jgi:CubicO group peptidase (beta-lactamase class C family)
MKFTRRSLILSIFVLVLLATCFAGSGVALASSSSKTLSSSAAPSYSATIADARKAAQQLLAGTGADSLSVALMDGSRVVWREGFGYADKGAKAKSQTTTMYGIGSTSKMLATVAAMRLVDQGKLNLDVPIVQYLPQFKMASPEYRQITTRMLLDHTSGFPGTTYRGVMTGTYDPEYALETMASFKEQRLMHTPGTMAVYCNDGFTMIENIVAALSGKTFPRFVADEIFKPLGMTHTAYPLQPFADGSYAKIYVGSAALPQECYNVLASGGAYSTPTDMAVFGEMLVNGGAYGGVRILSQSSVAEMAKDQMAGTFTPAITTGARFGLGWDSVAENGLAAVNMSGLVKGGDTDQYHCSLMIVPKAHLAVVVSGVTPVDSTKAEALSERILLHALVEKKTISTMPRLLPTSAKPVKSPSGAQLSAIVGSYAGSNSLFQVIAAANNSISLQQWQAGTWVTLLAGAKLRADDRFASSLAPTKTLRAATGGGRSYLVLNDLAGYGHYRTDVVIGQRVIGAEVPSAVWTQRMGKTWLVANEDPQTVIFDGVSPALSLTSLPEVPGYVVAITPDLGVQVLDSGASDNAAYAFLVSPFSRDLCDVTAVDRNGKEWVREGAFLFRPASSVPALQIGENSVSFGAEGLGEWRKAVQPGKVMVAGASTWYVFDADMKLISSWRDGGYGLIVLPAGAHLLLYGGNGTSATVTFTS